MFLQNFFSWPYFGNLLVFSSYPHHSTIPQPNNFIRDCRIRLLGQKRMFTDKTSGGFAGCYCWALLAKLNKILVIWMKLYWHPAMQVMYKIVLVINYFQTFYPRVYVVYRRVYILLCCWCCWCCWCCDAFNQTCQYIGQQLIKHDQTWSETWSDTIRQDQTRSDMIKHDQTL
jgi:hypothetical protein